MGGGQWIVFPLEPSAPSPVDTETALNGLIIRRNGGARVSYVNCKFKKKKKTLSKFIFKARTSVFCL